MKYSYPKKILFNDLLFFVNKIIRKITVYDALFKNTFCTLSKSFDEKKERNICPEHCQG